MMDRSTEPTETLASGSRDDADATSTTPGLPEDINKLLMPPPSFIPKKIRTSSTVSDES